MLHCPTYAACRFFSLFRLGMAKIDIRVDDDLKKRVEEAALRLEMKPSELVRAVLAKTFPATAEKSPPDKEESSDESMVSNAVTQGWGAEEVERKTVHVTTRLTPSESREVERRAVAMGMKPGTWIMRLVRAVITRNPQLSFDEVHALREATRELSYVGRNLNQVAHAVNITPNAQAKVTAELISETRQHIEIMRNQIKSVLDENVYRWGI